MTSIYFSGCALSHLFFTPLYDIKGESVPKFLLGEKYILFNIYFETSF